MNANTKSGKECELCNEFMQFAIQSDFLNPKDFINNGNKTPSSFGIKLQHNSTKKNKKEIQISPAKDNNIPKNYIQKSSTISSNKKLDKKEGGHFGMKSGAVSMRGGHCPNWMLENGQNEELKLSIQTKKSTTDSKVKRKRKRV